jgi:hypothetical protein
MQADSRAASDSLALLHRADGVSRVAPGARRVAGRLSWEAKELRMSEKKPTPVPVFPARKNCPVCGKVAYSLGGVHPQCALARADATVRAKLKIERDRIEQAAGK